MLYGEWFCVGRLDDLGLAEPVAAWPWSTSRASRCWSPATSDGALHAAYNVCRHRGSQLVPGRRRADAAGAVRGRRRCAARTTRGPTASTAGCCGRRTPTLDDPDGVPRCTRSASRPGAASSSCTSRRSARRPLAEAVARRRPTRSPTTASADLVTGATLHLRGGGQLQGAARELQRVLPLRPGAPRAVPAGAGVRRRRRPTSTGRTASRTARAPGRSRRPAPRRARRCPGSTRTSATRHKGDLVYPNLMLSASADHVAAFVLLPRAVDRTDGRVLAAVRRRRGAPRPASTRPTPRDLWDLVNRQDWAICESVQRGMSSRSYRHGWFAPMEDDSLDIRRWLLPRLGAAGSADDASAVDYVVAGLGALGSATACELARRGHRSSGWSGSSSGTPAAPATTPAGSCGTATTRPAYVRLTQEAYADWARLERDTGDAAGHHGRRARPVPAGRRRSRPVDYIDVARRGRHRLRGARRRRGDARAGRSSGCPTGTLALHQARRRDRARPARGTRDDAGRRPARHGADLRDRTPGHSACATSARRGVEVATAARASVHCRRLVVCADAWANDVLGRPRACRCRSR